MQAPVNCSPWPNTAEWEAAIGTNGAHMTPSNQYGRTSFLFAGVPGMQLPVSLAKADQTCAGRDCLSVYEQVHNASLFSLYLPIANEADFEGGQVGRQYRDDFYHTLLMTNHMESELLTFADGIRGRTLWHNEYRSKYMCNQEMGCGVDNNSTVDGKPAFPITCAPNAPASPGCITFPAAFTSASHKVPYHNYTCDGCHVRNGSGIPLKPDKTLDVVLRGPPGCTGNSCFMNATYTTPYKISDATFTGVITPMKLVFFDLGHSEQ
jgi:hypothetical protein